MDKQESLTDFYQRKFDWIPENLTKDWGHFNVFKLDPFIGAAAQPVPYRRRDFYKITLVKGQGKIFFANKVIEVKNQAIVFSNPFIPYKWENTDQIHTGYFCIFNQLFFSQFGNINAYSIYQPSGIPVVELSAEGYTNFEHIFEKMLTEINGEYIHKYDVLRSLALELMHTALKMEPANTAKYAPGNANQKVSMLFLELLERQFPIEGQHNRILLKTASEFANQLSVHVNHLNRAVKETTQKTTSQLIAERVAQEAKMILKQSDWSVTEIADALGFNETSYFNQFFKKGIRPKPGETPEFTHTYPRNITVEASTNGSDWKVVQANVKGTQGDNIITLPATRAKFMRLKLAEGVTAAADDVTPWSMRSMKIFGLR